MDIPRYYASGEEPGPLHDGVRQYRGSRAVAGCWAKAGVPNRLMTEKGAAMKRMMPPQVLVMSATSAALSISCPDKRCLSGGVSRYQPAV